MITLSRVFVLALAAVAVGFVAFFGARTIVDDDGGGGTVKAADQGFTLEYPDTWKSISKEELALFPGSPRLVLQRDGNSRLFVVRKESKAAPTKASFGDELDKEISDRVADYKPGSVRTVETAAGPAFDFSLRAHPGGHGEQHRRRPRRQLEFRARKRDGGRRP